MRTHKRVAGHLRRLPHSRKQIRVRGHLALKRTHYK